ncbi:H-type small acid-soluble spore protein [Halalkalibacterium ligniniphilum]|uniref:H-type small acid-soluble spore protein n=1 Tax=Halalkalibacterium ligniniphilum TaxID=1134413 RepID=UPI000349C10C|nr:H-type small acid-soluble spore protein [Halalkalibacterium ligniniphilum]
MDLKRASQIISSPKEIEVTYHGVPVRLIHTNQKTNTVSVKTDPNSNDIMVLPVEELEEGESRE